jgi:hypothetical protein
MGYVHTLARLQTRKEPEINGLLVCIDSFDFPLKAELDNPAAGS